MQLDTGSTVRPRTLTAVVDGAPVAVPDPERLVHLQFRRFAGCPICHLHLRSVVRRHDEIAAAGIREVVVFHSGADELREHVADLPFAVIADPRKRLYAEFGVESSPAPCWPRAPGGPSPSAPSTSCAAGRSRRRSSRTAGASACRRTS